MNDKKENKKEDKKELGAAEATGNVMKNLGAVIMLVVIAVFIIVILNMCFGG